MAERGDRLVEIVVEWLQDSYDRTEWDEVARRAVLVDRPDKSAPPEHYGCIPGALCPGDSELLDVLLLREGERVYAAGDVLPARVLGVLRRSDGDHKLIAVDPRDSEARALDDINPDRIAAVWDWFTRQHVLLDWAGPEEAWAILEYCRRLWALTHGGD